MAIQIIPFSKIPFDELTKEYMFNQRMSFSPVIPFNSSIVAQSGGVKINLEILISTKNGQMVINYICLDMLLETHL